MSQENVEVVRSMIDAWNARRLDDWLNSFHPDVELTDLQTVLGMQYQGRGLDQLRRMSEQWIEIFPDYRAEVRELADLGGGFVLADLRYDGVGRDSGARVSGNQFDICRVGGGKIVEYHAGFRGRAEALEAFGLRE